MTIYDTIKILFKKAGLMLKIFVKCSQDASTNLQNIQVLFSQSAPKIVY